MNTRLNTSIKPEGPMEVTSTDKKKLLFIYVSFIILTFILLYLSPYTRDDWAWGSSIGLDRMYDLFRDYNGRYGGNLVEIFLTRYRLIKAVAETAILTILIYYLVPRKQNYILLTIIAMCLILLEPQAMLRQTLVYTAGFSNYIVPTMFLFIFLKYFAGLLEVQNHQDLNYKKRYIFPLALAAFVSCLFMENLTLYFFGLAVLVIIYSLIKFKKVFHVQWAFLMGSVLGNILMFTNGAYWNVLSGDDNYRSLGSSGSGSVDQHVSLLGDSISYVLFEQNFVFNIMLSLSVLIVIIKHVKSAPHRRLHLLNILPAFALSFLSIFDLITGIAGIVFYFMLLLWCFSCIIIYISDIDLRKKSAFVVLSLFVVNAPFIIVNPVSPRCFFTAYTFMILIVLYGFTSIKINRKINIPAFIALILTFAYLINIYYPIYKEDLDRLQYIRDKVAQGSTRVEIPYLSNEGYVWIITPKSGTKWEYRYKKFYGIPEHVELINTKEQFDEVVKRAY